MCDNVKYRIFILILFIAVFASLSAVCANENTTVDESVLTDSGNNTISQSEITSSNVVGYESFETQINIKLTSDSKPLPSKEVSIDLNGKNYKKITDSNGMASLSVNLAQGKYTAQFTFLGDNTTSGAVKTSTITIKQAEKTSLTIGDKDINYRQGSKCLFYVKLLNSKGKAVKNQEVTFKVAGHTFTAKTDSSGAAKIYLNLKKGTHRVYYSFKKNAPYLSSSGSYKIKVKQKMAKGNGYWLWSDHMKKVNLKNLAKRGTKHILLHTYSIYQYGKASVVSFIKKAHRYGLKVHLWMQVCYSNGKWVSPVNKGGSLKYAFLNKKVNEAKKYAKIKGVDGIHFDYVRFGGTAYLYKNSNHAINYFAKKASIQVHKIKSNMIVSAAVMPEPSMMIYYYGQDIPTMSKYLDVVIPMVYKESYGKSTSWVKSVTKSFVSKSNGAQLWTGLQTYHAKNNSKKLSQKTLLTDARSAKAGGATGIILFRIGVSCNFYFNKI